MSGTTAIAMSSSLDVRLRHCRTARAYDANKVQGCASQVWLVTHVKPDGAAGPVLTFEGDSDAHIVRGLIAILFALYSGKRAREILATDALALFDRIGLARKPHAAALERLALDGRAHPRRRRTRACAAA